MKKTINRKIVKTSMNPMDEKIFTYLQERIHEPDMSRAIKKAILFTHLYLDDIKERVPHPVLELFFDNLTYKKNLSIGNFYTWARENLPEYGQKTLGKTTKKDDFTTLIKKRGH